MEFHVTLHDPRQNIDFEIRAKCTTKALLMRLLRESNMLISMGLNINIVSTDDIQGDGKLDGKHLWSFTMTALKDRAVRIGNVNYSVNRHQGDRGGNKARERYLRIQCPGSYSDVNSEYFIEIMRPFARGLNGEQKIHKDRIVELIHEITKIDIKDELRRIQTEEEIRTIRERMSIPDDQQIPNMSNINKRYTYVPIGLQEKIIITLVGGQDVDGDNVGIESLLGRVISNTSAGALFNLGKLQCRILSIDEL